MHDLTTIIDTVRSLVCALLCCCFYSVTISKECSGRGCGNNYMQLISKECTGMKCNNRVGQLLVRSALVEDAAIEECDH
jgi:hypothetical protein